MGSSNLTQKALTVNKEWNLLISPDSDEEINKKIIDLSSPLLTKEAKKSLSDEMYAPIDVSELNSKNIYYIIRENSMSELFDENRFSSLFEPYSRIYMMEKKRYDNYMKSLND